MTRLFSVLACSVALWPCVWLALANDTIQIDDGGQLRLFRVAGGETSRSKMELREVGKESALPRFFTPHVLVELKAESNPGRVAEEVAAGSYRPARLLERTYVFGATNAAGVLGLTERLRQHPEVASAEPLLAKQRVKKLIPSDPLVSAQWHLRNAGLNGAQAGVDLSLTNTWTQFRGEGVVIGIVDDGLDTAHPDLASRIDPSLGYDWNEGDSDPAAHPERGDFHGTLCAGAAAAAGDNGIGVAGVAYEATLAGLRLISDFSSDLSESEATLFHNDRIHIKSNSWGPDDDGQTLDRPGPLTTAALAESVQTGRDGKGTIFVFPAGNGLDAGDDANYDGYANSIYTIAIGSVSDAGVQTDYSEPGACVIAVTPSGSFGRPGITTTDLRGPLGVNDAGEPWDMDDLNYTRLFDGTSASVALASGGVALILNTNPDLGWRDVQEILLRSATQVDPYEPDWDVNAAGFHFNHKYGAGLINIDRGAALAGGWRNLGERITVSSAQPSLAVEIPDSDPAGVTFEFNLQEENLRLEHVTLTATIFHPYRGDLAITLIAPSGMESRLAERHSDSGANYLAWRFMSVRHWGESSQGTWKLHIADLAPGDIGTVRSLRLDFHGTSAGDPNPVAIESAAWSDQSSGNGNEISEPGETITGTISLRNTGTRTLSGTAVLSSGSGGVTVLSAETNVGPLLPGEVQSLPAAFHLSPAVPCQSTVVFDLVTQLNGVTRTNSLRVRIGSSDPIWSIQSVDTAGSVGSYTSLAIDPSGRAHVSYYDASNGDLKYARQSGEGWLIETVDSAGEVGTYTSLILDGFGHPHIAYKDETAQRLKYAAWDGSSWRIETVPTPAASGSHASLQLNSRGEPCIAFMDESNDDLLYAQRISPSQWEVVTVDSTDRTGSDVSLAMGEWDRPSISYRNITLGDLKYAEWRDGSWRVETVEGAGTVGNDSSLRLGRDGEPLIAYRDTTNTQLKFARRTVGGWSIEVVDRSGTVGFDVALALNHRGEPRISYRDLGRNMLKYAAWNGAFWAIQTVDSSGAAGSHNSLAVDSEDKPRISYLDISRGDLKVAGLESAECAVFQPGPVLAVAPDGANVVLSWSALPGNIGIEGSMTLLPGSWRPVPVEIRQREGQSFAVIPVDAVAFFYRIVRND